MIIYRQVTFASSVFVFFLCLVYSVAFVCGLSMFIYSIY